MPPRFTLTLQTPDGSGQTWSFAEGEIVVGSDTNCDVVVLGRVGRHALLELGAELLEVEELGGETTVNGCPSSGRVEVGYPATIQVGEAVLRVERALPEDPDATILVEHKPATDPDATVFVEHRPVSQTTNGPGSADAHVAYALLKEIARGGMGQIYEGSDPQLARQVAVKVSSLAQGGEDPRFAQEAKVLAKLAHPNIVPVYNLGRDSQGRPFYSMKLVKGRSLQAILKQLQQGDVETKVHFTRARLLSVFQKVCDAMAFAHSKGILHRDLKPDNVMVGEFGEVLVMDWGLAKVIGTAETVAGDSPVSGSDFGMTLEGEVMGTPQYMSPEQAAGVVAELDERSDIYSLGGILYAISTLRPPIDGKTLDEVLSKVKSGDITPIETTVGGMAGEVARSKMELVSLELSAVVRKAMARERAQRYQTVAEFSADIEAYLNGFATQAEGAGLWRQLVLLVKRHKAIAAMVAVLLMVLPVFTLKLAASERRAVAERRVALEQRGLAEEQRQGAEMQRRVALANELKAEANAKRALEEKEIARRSAAAANLAAADAASRDLNQTLHESALANVPEDLRDDTWSYFNRKLDSSVTLLAKGAEPFAAVAPHPKAAGVFVTVQQDGWIRTLDVNTGEITDLFQLDVGPKGLRSLQGCFLAVSPDAQRLAVAVWRGVPGGRMAAQPTAIYRIRDGAKLADFPDKSGAAGLAFSPDGTLLLGVTVIGLQVWNAQTGQVQWNADALKAGNSPWLSKGLFSRDSRRLYAYLNGKFTEFDSRDGAVIKEAPVLSSGEWYCLEAGWGHVFSGQSGVLRKVRVVDGRILFENRIRNGEFMGTGVLPKSRNLLTASRSLDGGGLLQMWDNNLGSLLRSDYCWGDGGEIEVHPLSGEVVQAKGPKMRVWRLEVFHPKLELTSKKIYADVSRFLGEPWWFARNRSASDGWCLEILDLRKKDYNTSPSFLLPCGKNHSQSLLTQDGSWLVMAGGEDSRTVDVWRREGESYSQIASWKADVVLERIACLSPKGERFWGGKALYETLTGKRLFAVDHDDISGFRGVTLLWGGQRLFGKVLFGGKNHPEKPGIALWDAASGRRMATEFSSVALTIGVTEDGGLLAEGGADKKIRIRSGETLKVEREFRAHDGVVTGVLWHPKRPLLVSVSEDLTIKIWDRTSWQVVEEIRGLSSVPEEMSVSSDGLALSVFFKRESKTRIYEPVSFRGEGK